MKVLGLQLFIDDIIGSCNFTTFSIMRSTRVALVTDVESIPCVNEAVFFAQ